MFCRLSYRVNSLSFLTGLISGDDVSASSIIWFIRVDECLISIILFSYILLEGCLWLPSSYVTDSLIESNVLLMSWTYLPVAVLRFPPSIDFLLVSLLWLLILSLYWLCAIIWFLFSLINGALINPALSTRLGLMLMFRSLPDCPFLFAKYYIIFW